MKVTRILHASVNTADAADETAAFYRDVLGLEPSTFRPEIPGVPGHWFEARNAQVHLVGRAPSTGYAALLAHVRHAGGCNHRWDGFRPPGGGSGPNGVARQFIARFG